MTEAIQKAKHELFERKRILKKAFSNADVKLNLNQQNDSASTTEMTSSKDNRVRFEEALPCLLVTLGASPEAVKVGVL